MSRKLRQAENYDKKNSKQNNCQNYRYKMKE